MKREGEADHDTTLVLVRDDVIFLQFTLPRTGRTGRTGLLYCHLVSPRTFRSPTFLRDPFLISRFSDFSAISKKNGRDSNPGRLSAGGRSNLATTAPPYLIDCFCSIISLCLRLKWCLAFSCENSHYFSSNQLTIRDSRFLAFLNHTRISSIKGPANIRYVLRYSQKARLI